MADLKYERIYDLSQPIYGGMPVHPSIAASGLATRLQLNHVPMHLPRRPGVEPGWPIWHSVELSSHTGTHIDSQQHVNAHGKSLEEIELDRFMGKGVVLDMRYLFDRPSTAITVDDFLKAQPQVEEGDIVIVDTGWHKKWGHRAYLEEHPGMDGDSIKEFLVEKKVKMLGIDTICPEVGSEHNHWPHPLHRVCLVENDIPLLETLGGQIDEVAGKRCYIIALPIRLQADAGPARAIALI